MEKIQKNQNRVENMERVNLRRKAKSHAIVFFLSVIDNMGNLNEVMWSHHLKHLSNAKRVELWKAFCKLPNIGEIENRQDVYRESNEYSLTSYSADQVLKLMGINFNKNKLKKFSRKERKQNKELVQLVLSVIKSDPNAYRETLDLFIEYWILDYELRPKCPNDN